MEQKHVGSNAPVIPESSNCSENPNGSAPEVCYSHNNEVFNEDFQIVLDEFADTAEVGQAVTYWQGKPVRFKHANFLCIDQLIENMQGSAWDESPEGFGEDYLDDLSDEKKAELNTLILSFLDANAAQPTFYSVIDIEQIDGWWDGEDVTRIPMMTATEVSNLID